MKKKHLTIQERIAIENRLTMKSSFKQIGRDIHKDYTTVSKESRTNFVIREVTGYGRVFNICTRRHQCKLVNSACPSCTNPIVKRCSICKNNCRSHYKEFVEDKCPKLDKPPYVCNACDDRNKCTLTKHFYYALQANKNYTERLIESRSGICITEAEIQHLNDLLVPLIKGKGQSIDHVFINHQDEIMMSEKTLYKLIDLGIL